MGPILQNLRRSRITGGGGGSSWRGYGANLPVPARWNGCHPYANQLRAAHYWLERNTQTLIYVDPVTGWIKNLPAGAEVYSTTHDFAYPAASYYQSGTYIATTATTGAYCTVLLFGTGTVVLQQGTLGSPTARWTLPDRGEYGDYSDIRIQISVHNGSGGTIASITDVYSGLEANKVPHDAGEVFDPLFIADLQGVHALRFMQWSNIAFRRGEFDFSTIPTEANFLWFDDNWLAQGAFKRFFFPFSLMAKLCKKLGCAMWINFDAGNQRLFYDVNVGTNTVTTLSASRVGGAPGVPRAHGYVEDEPIALMGWEVPPAGLSIYTQYFVHVVNSTQIQLKSSAGGSVVTITGAINGDGWGSQINNMPDPAFYFQQVAALLYSIYPEGTIISEVSNEAWNGNYERGLFDNVWATKAGATAPQRRNGWGAGIGYAYMTLQLWKAVELYFPRAQHIRTCIGQAVSIGGLAAGAFQYVDPGFIQAGATFVSLADMYAPALYYGPRLPDSAWVGTSNRLTAYKNAGLKDWTDAQFVQAYKDELDWQFNLGTGPTYSDNWMNQVFRPARAAKPTILIGAYEGGNAAGDDNLNQAPDADYPLMADRVYQFLRSPSMGDVATYFKAKLDAAGVNQFTQFEAAGSWFSGLGGFASYGMKKSHQVSDTAYATAMKAWIGA